MSVGPRKEAESERTSGLPSDSHAAAASTQCVPGPFGGRLPAPSGKKKTGTVKEGGWIWRSMWIERIDVGTI